ncbi:MAG: cadherin-like domain-containing protein [Bacteroidota bacterium]
MRKLYFRWFLFFLIISPFLNSGNISAQSCSNDELAFKAGTKYLEIWNGSEYIPFFQKGINLGVAVPGTFPGQMAASREDYIEWIDGMRQSGLNSIRVYTLHYPHFYEVLDSINRANPSSPIYLFQGVWLREELEGYDNDDLYYLSESFDESIEEIVDCIHGNRTIDPRPGEAHGVYETDISQWVIAYVLGREVHPAEIIATDEINEGINNFSGEAFSINNASPSEAWITNRLDNIVSYERNNYNTERPVSFSSWPTLDPLSHPTETNTDEDIADIDISKINISNAPAGLFALYHAYPYYPDFISEDPYYQTFYDYIGQNSYLGYLTDLKNHYSNMPLIIGEFGTSSSWGIAHYSNSGIYHGGHDEVDQGYAFIRMLENTLEAGCSGGFMFSWIDEWFKRTWLTDFMDFDPDRRILWNNITAAEQNFGLIKFEKPEQNFQILWQDDCDNCHIYSIAAKADYTFLHLKLGLKNHLNNSDTIWLALDTYDAELGESVLPSGNTVTDRAEFALRITNYSSELYVTQAYDLYGVWHGISGPEQLYHSISTDGEPWNIVRWKTNSPEHEVHYIGQLKTRRIELPASSHDGVIISDEEVHIRLPWTLINFHDPSQMRVIHDDRNLPGTQDYESDGIMPLVFYKDFEAQASERFTWEFWNQVLDAVAVEKESLKILKERLPLINNPPIAFCREFETAKNNMLEVDANNGLLFNAMDFDGNDLEVYLIDYVANGSLNLYSDGSFVYIPDDNFVGMDSFDYQLFDGYHHSATMTAHIKVEGESGTQSFDYELVEVYPVPAKEFLNIYIPEYYENDMSLDIISMAGQTMASYRINSGLQTIQLYDIPSGMYLLRLSLGKKYMMRKIVVE